MEGAVDVTLFGNGQLAMYVYVYLPYFLACELMHGRSCTVGFVRISCRVCLACGLAGFSKPSCSSLLSLTRHPFNESHVYRPGSRQIFPTDVPQLLSYLCL